MWGKKLVPQINEKYRGKESSRLQQLSYIHTLWKKLEHEFNFYELI